MWRLSSSPYLPTMEKTERQERIMTSDDTRGDIKIISYWGDCIVLRLQRGKSVEIVRPDGSEITSATNHAGRDKNTKPKEFKQAELFSCDHDDRPREYANIDIFMPTRDRKESESGSESGATMAKKEMRK